LVPLDGSGMSEQALTVAKGLAQAAGAELILLHVLEAHPPATIHGEKHLATSGEATAYLEEHARGLLPSGKVTTHVHELSVNDVAESLASHADELAPDLVVMCAHGEHNLRDIFVGSMAQQIVTHGFRPVLVMRASSCAPRFPFRRILIPLDGKPEHEKGIPLATYVASKLGSAVTFATVVPTRGELSGSQAASAAVLPSATRAMLQIAEDEAVERLARITGNARSSGLQANALVVRGNPLEGIVRIAAETNADLIALTTHGRHGAEAFWEGSFAPRLYEKLKEQAFLFIPVQG
ncbi:MAG: universal stress protein, partial [Candidatus Brocadiia bacterium]